jgi:heat shock protein HslJ
MRKVILIPIALVAMVLLSILLAACSADEPEPTPLPEGTPVVETPEAELTVPATDEASQEEEVEPEATAENEAEALPTPPASGLTAVIVSGDSAGAGKPFSFDATQSQSDEAPIVGYVWSMGDGTTLFGLSIQHAYNEPGFYTVTLIITDENGGTDTTAKVVEIIDLEAEATPTAENEIGLVGTIWKLDNAIRGTMVILEFDEGKLSGSAGCNDYDAIYIYTIAEDATISISVSSISTTNNSCILEIMAQEQGYLDSLASASRIYIDGAKLTMETGSGSLTFTLVTE